MKLNQHLSSNVNPGEYAADAGRLLKGLSGEVVHTGNESWPYRAVIKHGGLFVASQEAKTLTEAREILVKQLGAAEFVPFFIDHLNDDAIG